MIVTAIVAPPAAMVVKRTGQTLPQLRLMKPVPDVVFVPSVTVVSLVAVKILRLMFMKKKTPKGVNGGSSDIPPPPIDQPQKLQPKEEVPRVEPPALPEDETQPKHAGRNAYCALCKTFH